MHTISSKITARIRKIRQERGYSQEYMAYRLEISQQSYSRLESGRQDLKITQLEDIAEVLAVCPVELMRDESPPETASVRHDVIFLLGRLEQMVKRLEPRPDVF